MKLNINDLKIEENTYYANNKQMFMLLVKLVQKRNYSKIIKNNKELLAWINEQLPLLHDKKYTLTSFYKILYNLI